MFCTGQQSIKGNVQSLQSTLEESKSIISSYIKFDLLNLAAEELNVYTKVEGNYLSSLSNEQAVAMLLNMLAVNNAQNQFLEALRHSVTLSSYPDKSHLDSHAFLVEDLEERLKVKPKKNKKRKDRKNSLSVEVKVKCLHDYRCIAFEYIYLLYIFEYIDYLIHWYIYNMQII